jgi:hypothetical protein
MSTLFPLSTHIPIWFLSVALTTSTVSSSTRFINWSNPRSTPVTLREPFSLIASCLSMYLEHEKRRPEDKHQRISTHVAFERVR